MVQAFSQLKHVLRERRISIAQLQRRLKEHGLIVNLKSLYRLARDDQPLERLNLRVAGMICQVCDIPLSKLIEFELTEIRLRRLSASKQKRLDALMDSGNQGRLTPAEREELRVLVHDAEEIALSNARKLASQRRSLASLHTEERIILGVVRIPELGLLPSPVQPAGPRRTRRV